MAALGRASETPERLWNMSMAMTTAEEVAALAASARLAQVCFHFTDPVIKGILVWSLM